MPLLYAYGYIELSDCCLHRVEGRGEEAFMGRTKGAQQNHWGPESLW
jgi:hypothetical protein